MRDGRHRPLYLIIRQLLKELSARRERPMSAVNTRQQDNASEIARLLEEKEKDLELAAKIGQSLLEQNRELQNRNDFLEESLNASNDTVVQLRHELQMRINLLHIYADYDDDHEACGSRERRSNVEHLQRRMKKLENENLTLRNEASNLKKISASLEEKERLHIAECAKQLDAANEKIARLQSVIAEKNEECAFQSAEVERLLQEVARRGSHEKALAAENVDLHEQLNEALTMHEELSAEIVEVQERYTEVMSMLHDAEEELRTFRHNQKSHRASSADSLYDSLASELEASDSGFYSAISTARSDSGPETSKPDMKRLHAELERIRFREPNEAIVEAPSLERVSMTETRSVAIETEPQQSLRVRNRQISHSSDDVVDVPSAVLAELVRRSMSIERQRLPSATNERDPRGSAPDLRIHVDDESSSPTQSPPTTTVHAVDIVVAHSPDLRRRLSDTSVEGSAGLHVWIPRDGIRKSDRRSSSSSANGTLSKTASTDSLAGYEGPKMGEPGKPGTRDLDFSIRRLNIRRQVEREYARFRRERGLSPLCIPFFPPPIPFKKRTASMLRSASLQHASDFLQRLLSGDRSRLLQPWKAVTNVGLLAAVRDGTSQGVLMRSAILHNPPVTPPSTPLMHRRYASAHPSPTSHETSGGIVDALGLCVPSESSPQTSLTQCLDRTKRNTSPLSTMITFDEPKSGIFMRSAFS
uniref:HAP1 N-terminal domain-containing protein n=1 Tax=Parascaris univalens TaxID=6257 RepID=A0A915BLR9_PARUN